ncbi:MAG: hypothetical protein Q7J38_10315 [Gallionella sp.]|nr:hypothetical protein [Gallionella sp.]
MNEIVMYEPDDRGFRKALDYCKEWSAKHQAEIGVAEIALGAGIIAWGVQSGQIEMGIDFVASKLSENGLSGSTIGTGVGAGIGGMAGNILGSIGIAAMGTAVAIPAVAVIGGSAAIFSLFGNKIGEMFTPSHGDFGDFCAGASIVAVGAALMIDGARRIVKDKRVLQMASKVKDGVIQLAPLTTEAVARTWKELQDIINKLAEHPEAKVITVSAATGTAAATGALLGASSVTVLGSHGLGALAISLGLVSAPVWPIIAAGAGGLVLSMAAWKGVQHYRNKRGDDEPPHGGLLPSPDKN